MEKNNFDIFPHVFKKSVYFKKKWHKEKQTYINYLYIYMEVYAEGFTSDLCIEFHLQLLLL